MFIYVVSSITNKVIVPHNTDNLRTDVQFFEVALKLVIKLNHKSLPANIEVGNDTCDYLGVEITGVRLSVKQTQYDIFIQGLTSDDFSLYCGTTEKPTDV